MEREALPMAAYTRDEFAAWEAIEAQAATILAERMKSFRVPKLRFEPSDSDILVFRLPPKEHRTKGGLIIPSFTKDKTDRGEVVNNTVIVDVGILLAAGNGARDWMRSHGIFVGDYVRFGHYAGREQASHIFDAVHEVEGDLTDFLQLMDKDIRGSFDLHWRVNGDEYVDKEGQKQRTEPVLRRVYVHDGRGDGLTIFKPIVKEKK